MRPFCLNCGGCIDAGIAILIAAAFEVFTPEPLRGLAFDTVLASNHVQDRLVVVAARPSAIRVPASGGSGGCDPS